MRTDRLATLDLIAFRAGPGKPTQQRGGRKTEGRRQRAEDRKQKTEAGTGGHPGCGLLALDLPAAFCLLSSALCSFLLPLPSMEFESSVRSPLGDDEADHLAGDDDRLADRLAPEHGGDRLV